MSTVEHEDPFEGVLWMGWARYGRQLGAKWHRVIQHRAADGETVVEPLCGGIRMRPTTVIMDYRWSPSPDQCLKCWPPGLPHPGILSDLPRRER